MARTYKTIAGLTYADLDRALTQLGYARRDTPDTVLYEHPEKPAARLKFAPLPPTQEVRGIDLLAALRIVDGFGVADGKDFELLLLRLTGVVVPALTR